MSRNNAKDVFFWVEQCLLTTENERELFLQKNCGYDPKLLHDAMSLLKACDQIENFLESSIQESISGMQVETQVMPEKVDAYTLVEILGQGGMANVYLAIQEKPIRRKAALKLLKLRTGDPQLLARFTMEYQMLAQMNHPNVATVYDAGLWNHRPYFTMEFVNGVPINNYCNNQDLNLAQRLELFLQACQGVSHAHFKGIIHRDLKPSNILVEDSDHGARVKVIDFGIAKTKERSGFQENQLLDTQEFQIIGTPPYMSPEQIEGDTRKIDTRADIYGLGAVLFQLITDKPPFGAERLANASWSEKIRIIKQEKPPKPSELLKSRRTGNLSGNKRIRNELDWLMLKALAKNPEDRYQTVTEMVSDIRNFLSHQPLKAKSPNLGYRLGKFLYRNYGKILIISALILSLTFVVTANLEALQTRKSADTLEEFISTVLTIPNPYAVDSSQEMADLLLRASSIAGERFAAFPLNEAGARFNIAKSFASLGLYSNAIENCQRALVLREKHLGMLHSDSLLARERLIFFRYQAGELAEAGQQYDQLLPLLKKALAPQDPLIIKVRRGQANVLMDQGNPQKARDILSGIIDAIPWDQGRNNFEYLVTMNGLGNSFRELRNAQEADWYYKRACDGFSQLLGPLHPNTLGARFDQIQLLQDKEKHPEALPLLTELLNIREKVLGPRHPETLRTRSSLGKSLNHLGRYEEAEAILIKTFALQQSLLGENHLDTIQTANNLSISFAQTGRLDSAITLLASMTESLRQRFGLKLAESVKLHNNLADYLIRNYRADKARDLLMEVLPKAKEALGVQHPESLIMQCTLAEACMQMGDLKTSRSLLEELMVLAETSFGNDSNYPAIFKAILGRNYMMSGQKKEAEQLLSEAWQELKGKKSIYQKTVYQDLLKLKKN